MKFLYTLFICTLFIGCVSADEEVLTGRLGSLVPDDRVVTNVNTQLIKNNIREEFNSSLSNTASKLNLSISNVNNQINSNISNVVSNIDSTTDNLYDRFNTNRFISVNDILNVLTPEQFQILSESDIIISDTIDFVYHDKKSIKSYELTPNMISNNFKITYLPGYYRTPEDLNVQNTSPHNNVIYRGLFGSKYTVLDGSDKAILHGRSKTGTILNGFTIMRLKDNCMNAYYYGPVIGYLTLQDCVLDNIDYAGAYSSYQSFSASTKFDKCMITKRCRLYIQGQSTRGTEMQCVLFENCEFDGCFINCECKCDGNKDNYGNIVNGQYLIRFFAYSCDFNNSYLKIDDYIQQFTYRLYSANFQNSTLIINSGLIVGSTSINSYDNIVFRDCVIISQVTPDSNLLNRSFNTIYTNDISYLDQLPNKGNNTQFSLETPINYSEKSSTIKYVHDIVNNGVNNTISNVNNNISILNNTILNAFDLISNLTTRIDILYDKINRLSFQENILTGENIPECTVKPKNILNGDEYFIINGQDREKTILDFEKLYGIIGKIPEYNYDLLDVNSNLNLRCKIKNCTIKNLNPNKVGPCLAFIDFENVNLSIEYNFTNNWDLTNLEIPQEYNSDGNLLPQNSQFVYCKFKNCNISGSSKIYHNIINPYTYPNDNSDQLNIFYKCQLLNSHISIEIVNSDYLSILSKFFNSTDITNTYVKCFGGDRILAINGISHNKLIKNRDITGKIIDSFFDFFNVTVTFVNHDTNTENVKNTVFATYYLDDYLEAYTAQTPERYDIRNNTYYLCDEYSTYELDQYFDLSTGIPYPDDILFEDNPYKTSGVNSAQYR